MARTKQQLQEVELYLSYCVYRNYEDEVYNYVDELASRKEAREYIKKHRLSQRVMVCASAEYPNSGVYEFAYGNTQAEAVRKLNSELKCRGLKAVDLWKK